MCDSSRSSMARQRSHRQYIVLSFWLIAMLPPVCPFRASRSRTPFVINRFDVRVGEAGLSSSLIELIVMHEAAPLAVHQAEVVGVVLAELRDGNIFVDAVRDQRPVRSAAQLCAVGHRVVAQPGREFRMSHVHTVVRISPGEPGTDDTFAGFQRLAWAGVGNVGVIGREKAYTQRIFQKRVDPVERSARTASCDLDAVIVNHDPEGFLAEVFGLPARRFANEDPRISRSARRNDLHPGSRSLRHEVAELGRRVALGRCRIRRDHDRPGRHLPDGDIGPSGLATIKIAAINIPIRAPDLSCRREDDDKNRCMSAILSVLGRPAGMNSLATRSSLAAGVTT